MEKHSLQITKNTIYLHEFKEKSKIGQFHQHKAPYQHRRLRLISQVSQPNPNDDSVDWPAAPVASGFKPELDYFRRLAHANLTILTVLEQALAIPEGFLTNRHLPTHNNSTFRINHYPALKRSARNGKQHQDQDRQKRIPYNPRKFFRPQEPS